MTRRQKHPPWSDVAEEEVLAAMLLTRDAAQRALDVLVAPDFYQESHRKAFAAAEHLHAGGQPITLATVTEQLRRDVGQESARKIHAYLERLIKGAPVVGSITEQTRIVAELAVLRRAITLGGDITDAAYDADLDRVQTLLDAARVRLDAPAEEIRATEASKLAADSEFEQRPWAVHGLMRVRDRLGLSGAEGRGKSSVLRQLAVCAASGLTPFTHENVPRVPVLVVDLQEDADELGAQLRWIIRAAGTAYPGDGLYAVSRPQGMDLLARSERRWLEGLVRTHRPALLVVGPLRKMYRAPERFNKSSEEAADELTRILDDLRVGYDMAVAVEGHAGHDRENSWRFRGSSVWLDWFNFGFGLEPLKGERNEKVRRTAMKRWRGDRPPGRPWPRLLISGREFPWEDADQPPLEPGQMGESF